MLGPLLALLLAAAPAPVVADVGADIVVSGSPAEVLVAARAAEADLDYERARRLIDGLLSRPDCGPQERLQAHALAGQIERTAGNDAVARDHFLIVLRADRTFALPANTPPKVRTFFEAIRDEVAAEPVVVTPVEVAGPVVVERAPPSPVAGIVVTSVGAAVGVAGIITGVAGEVVFADAGGNFDDRQNGRATALAGWAGTAVGAVVTVVGVVLLLAE